VRQAALLALPRDALFLASWLVFLTELLALAGGSVFTAPVPALSPGAVRYRLATKRVIPLGRSHRAKTLNSVCIEINLSPDRMSHIAVAGLCQLLFFKRRRPVSQENGQRLNALSEYGHWHVRCVAHQMPSDMPVYRRYPRFDFAYRPEPVEGQRTPLHC
jgi:hypothetical protein